MRAAPRLIGYRLGEPHERHLPTGTPAITMRRSIKTLVATTVLALTAATGAGAAIATAAPASAQVLISYDGGTIHLGQSMQVGVWYQKFSGGPTGYWEGVWSYPQKRWIFTHSGHAISSHWQFWWVKPSVRGKYATVYNTSYKGHNYRTVFYTTVK